MGRSKARAPGKLILSGEHAVVHDCPALAVALENHIESIIESTIDSNIDPHANPFIYFDLNDLHYSKTLSTQALFDVRKRINHQYQSFTEGQCRVVDILQHPVELLQYTVSEFLEQKAIRMTENIKIKTSSIIPIGCGMGSSAAMVISMLLALTDFYKNHLEATTFLNLAKRIENLQHGQSSGVDLQLSLNGGCLKFQSGMIESRSIPTMPLIIAHTGKPESTTGECVAHTASYFDSSSLCEDFSAVTKALDSALITHTFNDIAQAIRENHRLLMHIEVVPPKVQNFIHQIEQLGFAAKICGAGAVRGEQAGVVWIKAPFTYPSSHANGAEIDQEAWRQLIAIAENFNYSMEQVQIDQNGAQLDAQY